jgi:hypothetical protein
MPLLSSLQRLDLLPALAVATVYRSDSDLALGDYTFVRMALSPERLLCAVLRRSQPRLIYGIANNRHKSILRVQMRTSASI